MRNNYMYISRLVLYVQQVEEEKKKKAGIEKRQIKKAKSVD